MKSTALIVLAILTLVSCDNYREPDPVVFHYVKVADTSRDTIMAIVNEKLATTASITMKGMLSDTASIKFSSDTLFSKRSGFVLPIHGDRLLHISGLTGDSLFIKYQPLNTPISGDLTIEITFRK